MATRRMRIKATINVPRGGIKSEPQEVAPTTPSTTPTTSSSTVALPETSEHYVSSLGASPGQVFSGGTGTTLSFPKIQQETQQPEISLASVRAATPPVLLPSSPKSPSPVSWLQRPSPSKSPATSLPPSGSILRRSPSPALSRLTISPGPSTHYAPLSPVKSPVPSYSASPHSPVKFFSRTPVLVIPTSTVAVPGVVRSTTPVERPVRASSASPGPADTNIKSPTNYLFRPPPSPSPSYHDFYAIKSPGTSSSTSVTISRPSPAQSPVYGLSRPSSNSSANFLAHHFNSNSNSADSHEVAALMGAQAVYSPSPEKRVSSSSGRDSTSGRNSQQGVGQGAFSSVSSNVNPSPSFAKTVFENPESLKKRSDDIRKKEGAQPNPTKFAAARKEFYDKLNSGQAPERSKLTMLHFTFYNPPNKEGATKLALEKRKSRSRASSICSDASSIAKTEKDLKNDENTAAKANSAPSSIAGSRRTTASSVGSAGSCAVSDAGHSEAGSVASNASSSGSMPGPRVKVGPDGQLIIDEKSLVVETSESQRARQQIEDMEVVSGAEYAVGSSGFYRYKKNYRRGQDWTERETIRFYRALNQCGTDFSMMLNLFPHRTRQELKAKFKREDRRNPDMISKALASCIFDPDEGISSEEDEDKGEGKEGEEVICSSEDAETGKNKKKGKSTKKKKEVMFSAVQIEELKTFKSKTKGSGTGKGKKWNTPVEGLEGGKLPPVPLLPFGIIPEIKEEKLESFPVKPKKKYSRKKKPCEGVASVVASPGPAPGTVSIIIASGVISTPGTADSAVLQVKEEKSEVPTLQKEKRKEGDTGAGSNKRRSRLPKAKPNLKKGGKDAELSTSDQGDKGHNSSHTIIKPGLCDDLFRLDPPGEPFGLKGIPTPLLVAQETDLVGNEEGSDSLVIVDLDELKSIQKETEATIKESTEPTKLIPPPKKRKNPSMDTSVTTSAVVIGVRDPYDKTVIAASSSSSPVVGNKVESSCSDLPTLAIGSQPAKKKVKVLPYRVPGPGGTLASTSTCSTSITDELEIEIEMSTTSANNES